MATTAAIQDPPYGYGNEWWRSTTAPNIISPFPDGVINYGQHERLPCLWNGPICYVCHEPYLGWCSRDHAKFLNGYTGRHR